MKYLLDAADGLTKIVTLSPEVDNGFKGNKNVIKNIVVLAVTVIRQSMS